MIGGQPNFLASSAAPSTRETWNGLVFAGEMTATFLPAPAGAGLAGAGLEGPAMGGALFVLLQPASASAPRTDSIGRARPPHPESALQLWENMRPPAPQLWG